MIVFSRPTYFCALAICILVLDKAQKTDVSTFTVYGIPFATNSTISYTRDFLLGKSYSSSKNNTWDFVCALVCFHCYVFYVSAM